MKKCSIPITKANYLINHGPAVLITSGTEERDNIMTLAANASKWQPYEIGYFSSTTTFFPRIDHAGQSFWR